MKPRAQLKTAWAGSTRARRLPKDWHRTRARILRRDHGQCQECGAPATEVDHIVAGDNHADTNLQALCTSHHKAKTQAEARAAKAAHPQPTMRRPREAHPGLR